MLIKKKVSRTRRFYKVKFWITKFGNTMLKITVKEVYL